MPFTHGSASKSSDPDTWIPPTLAQLDAANPRKKSPAADAVRRATTERRNPEPVLAGFDNKLSAATEPAS